MRRLAPAILLLAACTAATLQTRTNVRTVTDEADAVLAILDARAAGRPIPEAEWQHLFATEGYVRLKQREHSMQRPFEDDAFRTFAMSAELLEKRGSLKRALSTMKAADLSRAAALAMAYLPPHATITARVYPVIKPRENSFVFEHNAIFLYVEEQPAARFEETIAHEMHHIGYGTACPPREVEALTASLPPPKAALQKWLSAFGEGFAALAAVGGPQGSPYAAATPDVREAWARGATTYEADLRRVEAFYLDVLDGRLTGDAVDKRGFEFFGLVGPWYTVGWTMARTIEEELGRDALIAAFCDQRTLLGTYNRAAAARGLPRFSERLVAAFDGP